MNINFIPTDLYFVSKEDLNTPIFYKIHLKCRNYPDLLAQPLKIFDGGKIYTRRPRKLHPVNENKMPDSTDSLHNTRVDRELKKWRL